MRANFHKRKSEAVETSSCFSVEVRLISGLRPMSLSAKLQITPGTVTLLVNTSRYCHTASQYTVNDVICTRIWHV